MVAARLPTAARMILKITRTDIIRTQRKRVARISASTGDVIRIQGFRINARWWRDFLAHDPRPALARITVPVLAITGGQDVQVPPQDVAKIGRLAQRPFEGHVTGNLSLFRPDPASAGPRAYRRAVREPVDAEVLKLITSWIKTHWAASPRPAAQALSRLRTQTICSGQRHKDRAGRVPRPFRANAILRAHRMRADLGRRLRLGHDRPAELDRMPAKMSDKCRGCLAGQGVLTRGTGMAATKNIPLWHG
jgi:hypothetical protein